MTRRCIMYVENERCLGHPEVDDERWPALCAQHLEYFMPMIEMKARVLADQMLMERLATRPRFTSSGRGTRTATPQLKPGQHLSEQDQVVLNFLRGVA